MSPWRRSVDGGGHVDGAAIQHPGLSLAEWQVGAGRCAAHDRVWNMLVLVSMPHMFCSAKNKDDVSMNTARVYGSYSRGHKPITWQQFSKSVRASAAVATLVQRCGKFLTQTNLHKLPCAGVHARRSRHVATRGAMPLACYDTLVQHSIHHAIHQ